MADIIKRTGETSDNNWQELHDTSPNSVEISMNAKREYSFSVKSYKPTLVEAIKETINAVNIIKKDLLGEK